MTVSEYSNLKCVLCLQGCLRSMTVEKRRIGIPDARVTNGILPDCVWEYPCAQEPCVAGSQCLQQGVDSFRCECDQLLCIKPDYAESYKVRMRIELLHLYNIKNGHTFYYIRGFEL